MLISAQLFFTSRGWGAATQHTEVATLRSCTLLEDRYTVLCICAANLRCGEAGDKSQIARLSTAEPLAVMLCLGLQHQQPSASMAIDSPTEGWTVQSMLWLNSPMLGISDQSADSFLGLMRWVILRCSDRWLRPTDVVCGEPALAGLRKPRSVSRFI